MGLMIVLPFLLADDPFIVGKAQLREAMARAEVLLVATVYVSISAQLVS